MYLNIYCTWIAPFSFHLLPLLVPNRTWMDTVSRICVIKYRHLKLVTQIYHSVQRWRTLIAFHHENSLKVTAAIVQIEWEESHFVFLAVVIFIFSKRHIMLLVSSLFRCQSTLWVQDREEFCKELLRSSQLFCILFVCENSEYLINT